jgi:hypothetical protein
MRISSLAVMAVFTLAAGPALAVQDTPTVSNGIETVCTGVGSAKDDPRWNSYPVKLVFSNGADAFVAGVHVTLKKGGQTLVETDCDAPWVLFKLPGGKYTATATLIGGSAAPHSADILTSGSGKQEKVEISFAHPSAP